MACVIVTDLEFIIATNHFSTRLAEKEKPVRKRKAKGHSVRGSGQRLHKRHRMPLGNFGLVPIPVDIDTET